MVKEQLDSGHPTPVLKLGNLSQNELGTAEEVAPAYTMGSNVTRQVGQSLGPELGGEDRNTNGEKTALHVLGRSRARRCPGEVQFRYLLSVLADRAAIFWQNVPEPLPPNREENANEISPIMMICLLICQPFTCEKLASPPLGGLLKFWG